MNERKYVSVGSFTSSIIFGHILYGILVTIVIAIVAMMLGNFLLFAPTWVQSAVAIVLSVIGTIVAWKLAVKSVLKKKTTDRSGIQSIVKNLFVFLVAMIVLGTVVDVINFENKINETIEITNNRYENSILGDYYKTELEETVSQARKTEYTTLVISTIVDLVVNIAMIRYVKYKLEAEL